MKANKGSSGVGFFISITIFKDYIVHIIDKKFESIIGVELGHNISDYVLIIYSWYLPPEGCK